MEQPRPDPNWRKLPKSMIETTRSTHRARIESNKILFAAIRSPQPHDPIVSEAVTDAPEDDSTQAAV
jgi:hypothetical protein